MSNTWFVTPTKEIRCIHGPFHYGGRPTFDCRSDVCLRTIPSGPQRIGIYPCRISVNYQPTETAINQAREYGLLGDHILGTDFSFDIEIRYGAGAFVCGEETALIHSMEGKRGADLKPPFPAESGYLGKPTNVNNVETFANIPIILTKRSRLVCNDWHRTFPKEPKCLLLPERLIMWDWSKCRWELLFGEVIYEIGGGIKAERSSKLYKQEDRQAAVWQKNIWHSHWLWQPSPAGSMMGSGGWLSWMRDDCMVSVARFYLDFTVEKSCGKCTPALETNVCWNYWTRLHRRKRHRKDTGHTCPLWDKSSKIRPLCGLGQTSPNPVYPHWITSTMNIWNTLRDKTCRSKQCKSLLTYTISPERCIGCHLCQKLSGGCYPRSWCASRMSLLDKCIKCGMCMARYRSTLFLSAKNLIYYGRKTNHPPDRRSFHPGPEGSTILFATKSASIYLLRHIDLKRHLHIQPIPASCRICVVEVMGRPIWLLPALPSCTEGMVVKTSTLRVMNARKVVAELIPSDHPNDCLTCPKCAIANFRTLALALISANAFQWRRALSPASGNHRLHRAATWINVFSVAAAKVSVTMFRQSVRHPSRIQHDDSPAFDRMMTESECTYCGQCVAVCPVGALTERDCHEPPARRLS